MYTNVFSILFVIYNNKDLNIIYSNIFYYTYLIGIYIYIWYIYIYIDIAWNPQTLDISHIWQVISNRYIVRWTITSLMLFDTQSKYKGCIVPIRTLFLLTSVRTYRSSYAYIAPLDRTLHTFAFQGTSPSPLLSFDKFIP